MGWRNTDALSFLEKIPTAQTPAEVCAITARALPYFGMTWYFLGGAVPPGHPMLPALRYHNWPADLFAAFSAHEAIEHNPIPRITAVSHRPVTLTEYWQGAGGVSPNPDCTPLFDLLAARGMTHFLFVPIHGPRGPRGFGMLSGPGTDPAPRAHGLLTLLCHAAFMRLSDLDSTIRRQSGSETTLTDREVDVLQALAQGLDDAGIAAAHKITVRTVRFHIGNARKKLGARSRGEALILAAKGGFFPQ